MLRKETKNSYLQLQGTETWSTTYNDTEQTSSGIIIIIIIKIILLFKKIDNKMT